MKYQLYYDEMMEGPLQCTLLQHVDENYIEFVITDEKHIELYGVHPGDPLKVKARISPTEPAKHDEYICRLVGVRDKYVDEHFPRWHKFGGWVEPNGKVGDVCADGNDIVNNVTEEVADKLIKARNEFVDKLQEIFDEHPDQFNVYGPPIK